MSAGEKPWLANYPNGIPSNIDADAYNSLVDLLEESLKKYKDRKAFANMGKSITFEELDKLSSQFASYLHNIGLVKGDRIALMMPNLLQYPIALFGALRAGLIVVNTNPLYTAREMKHQFTDSGVKAIVIAENFAYNLEKIIGDTAIKHVFVTSIGEFLGGLKGGITNFVVRSVKKMVPKFNLPGAIKLKDAVKEGKKYTLPNIDRSPNETIFLQYTGGTTGVAKGAELTNRNIVANLQQMRAIMLPFLKQEGQNIALSPLPMYHIFALTVNCFGLFSVGSLSVLVTNARDLPSVIKEFNNWKVNLFTGVNTLFNALLNHKDFASADFSELRISVGGAMAVQVAVAKRWKEVTGCTLSEGYGMTEASPIITCNPLDDTYQIGTIGMPVPSTDVRIVDENGNPLPKGEVGEIQAKGPQVMKGYYQRPEETKKVLTDDGWLYTGDIGMLLDKGFFKIVDRKKDMILVSGFNVYPNEIEDVVAAHDKVLEVAAVGVPDEHSTEVVKIYVVKKDPSLTEKELSDYCKENLTGYKRPRHIEFRDELPKTNVGKILRRALRDEKETATA